MCSVKLIWWVTLTWGDTNHKRAPLVWEREEFRFAQSWIKIYKNDGKYYFSPLKLNDSIGVLSAMHTDTQKHLLPLYPDVLVGFTFRVKQFGERKVVWVTACLQANTLSQFLVVYFISCTFTNCSLVTTLHTIYLSNRVTIKQSDSERNRVIWSSKKCGKGKGEPEQCFFRHGKKWSVHIFTVLRMLSNSSAVSTKWTR